MEKNTTFTEGKIMQPLILFALPVLLALFLQAMYGAVDLLVIGKFATSADVSAVSTGSQIMMTLTNSGQQFCDGNDRAAGAADRKRQKRGGRAYCGDSDRHVCLYRSGYDNGSRDFCTSDLQHHECAERSLR